MRARKEQWPVPLVLMQRAWRDDPKYKDTEFVVYHYPARYFDNIGGGEKFVYYRPGRDANRDEASTYFGCGELGDWWQDGQDPSHRFVGIQKPIRFPSLVGHVDKSGRMYESNFPNRNAFQGRSIRRIADLDYYRILDAAGLTGAAWQAAPTVDDVLSGLVIASKGEAPLDPFRPLIVIPEGTGYRPSGKPIDIFESAALQERARADHQETLKLVKAMTERRGGKCDFNNNVDLLATFGSKRLLVEAKSLNAPSAAVDRMRYGMGQLFDYRVRYRAQIDGAQPVLAFSAIPSREVAWISTILQGNGVAFIARQRDSMMPMNEAARELPLFA